MNTKIILVATIGAIVITMTPVLAQTYYDISNAEVREKVHPKGKDSGLKIELYTDAAIPVAGEDLLGYGVLTSNWLVVTTSHGGVLDSETQADATDPIWHNHYVNLQVDTECPPSIPIGSAQLSVADLSWQSPGILKVAGSEVKITGVATGTVAGQTSGTDGGVTPIVVDTGSITNQVVSFQLSGGPSGQICVEVKDIITASN